MPLKKELGVADLASAQALCEVLPTLSPQSHSLLSTTSMITEPETLRLGQETHQHRAASMGETGLKEICS